MAVETTTFFRVQLMLLDWDDNWRWCNKCQGLFFARTQKSGVCPEGADIQKVVAAITACLQSLKPCYRLLDRVVGKAHIRRSERRVRCEIDATVVGGTLLTDSSRFYTTDGCSMSDSLRGMTRSYPTKILTRSRRRI